MPPISFALALQRKRHGVRWLIGLKASARCHAQPREDPESIRHQLQPNAPDQHAFERDAIVSISSIFLDP